MTDRRPDRSSSATPDLPTGTPDLPTGTPDLPLRPREAPIGSPELPAVPTEGTGVGQADAGGPSGAARYGGVLLLLVATFIVLAAAPTGAWATVLSTALQATTLLAALYAARSARLLFRVAVAVSLVSLAGAVIEAVAGSPSQRSAYFLVDVMLVAAAPAAIIVGIVRRRRLDIQTVLGALCVYVLIGLFWSFVYATINAFQTGSFFAQTTHPTTSDFVYFSFVTLTTTGYGDLTAAGGLGRAAGALEALLGQLYLVTVVALLVGNLGPRRPA